LAAPKQTQTPNNKADWYLEDSAISKSKADANITYKRHKRKYRRIIKYLPDGREVWGMLDLPDIEEASQGEEELIWEIKSTLEEGKEEELLNTEWLNCALFEYDDQGLAYIPGVDET
jgi:hypothetical protein